MRWLLTLVHLVAPTAEATQLEKAYHHLSLMAAD